MAESLLSGTGSALVPASPAVTFAFLADPRHAGAWFAGSGFAEPPSGSPRAGMTWRFERMRGTRRPVPARMSVYEPPTRFVWETQVGIFGVNNAWELGVEPASVEGEEPDQPPAPGARVTMTIRLRPRLFGWLAVLPALPLLRGQLPARAQRAADRAVAAVLDYLSATTRRPQPPRAPRPDRGRPRRRR
jgi:hypothetical protein